MKRTMLVLAALVAVASSTGCCCFDRLFCHGGCHGGLFGGGCGGGCGGCDDGCGWGGGGCGCNDGCPYGGGCGGGCGGGGCGCGDGGYAGGGNGGGGYAEGYAAKGGMHNCPSGGHPLVRHHRNAGGQYEYEAGPPTGHVAYPYYTTRGPRDFLAKNPRSIGP